MLCIIYELDVSLDFFLIGLLKYILYITQSLMKDQLFIVTQKNVVLNLKKSYLVIWDKALLIHLCDNSLEDNIKL